MPATWAMKRLETHANSALQDLTTRMMVRARNARPMAILTRDRLHATVTLDIIHLKMHAWSALRGHTRFRLDLAIVRCVQMLRTRWLVLLSAGARLDSRRLVQAAKLAHVESTSRREVKSMNA